MCKGKKNCIIRIIRRKKVVSLQPNKLIKCFYVSKTEAYKKKYGK